MKYSGSSTKVMSQRYHWLAVGVSLIARLHLKPVLTPVMKMLGFYAALCYENRCTQSNFRGEAFLINTGLLKRWFWLDRFSFCNIRKWDSKRDVFTAIKMWSRLFSVGFGYCTYLNWFILKHLLLVIIGRGTENIKWHFFVAQHIPSKQNITPVMLLAVWDLSLVLFGHWFWTDHIGLKRQDTVFYPLSSH